MEKNIHKVRHPFHKFPFTFYSTNHSEFDPHDSAEFSNFSRIESYDEPIVKVSPPTPLRKASFTSATETFRDKNTLDEKYMNIDSSSSEKLFLKLRSFSQNRKHNFLINRTITDKTVKPKTRTYSIKSCPYHKNEPRIQIFDDDLKKCLPKRSCSRAELSHRTLVLSGIHLEKSLSKSSPDLRTLPSRKVISKGSEVLKGLEIIALPEDINKNSKMENEIEKEVSSDTKKTTKTPKLATASLLASFAKTISIQSSLETHESPDENNSRSDSDIGSPSSDKYELESELKDEHDYPKTVPKDYLKVPKLGYASLHPSFRKLLPIDSFSDSEEIVAVDRIPKIVSDSFSNGEESEKVFINFQVS